MVKPRNGVSSYTINVMRGGHPARIRGIIYLPGCAVRTFDISPAPLDYEGYPFSCLPLAPCGSPAPWRGQTGSTGGRSPSRRSMWRAGRSEVLRVDESLLTSIPVGEPTELSRDGKFQLVVADLPIARRTLSQWRDRDLDARQISWRPCGTTGSHCAGLIKGAHRRLKIQRTYPDEVIFTPCASGRAQMHDTIGFAHRPDGFDACN